MRSVLLLLLLTAFPSIVSTKYERRVLLISLDGFRHDLLNETLVPHMHKFADRSSWFVNGVEKHLLKIFRTSFEFQDKHGIIGNFFWDRSKQEMYDKFHSTGGPDLRAESEMSKWNPIDPIWLLNRRNGGQSTVINWPAGDYERSERVGVRMTRYRMPFGFNNDWPKELEMVLNALETDNLVLWYIAEPDSTLHEHGFYDGKLEKKLRELDELFYSLMTQMHHRGLLNSTDITLTADHGHIQFEYKVEQIFKRVHKISIHSSISQVGNANIYSSNATLVNEMYQKLKQAIDMDGLPYKVYLQKDVPASWHYVNADRTGDIVIETLPGGNVWMHCNSTPDDSHSSSHGHSPNWPEMHALLVLSGPSFNEATKIDRIPENIDLFPLMRRLLQI
ncbi:hypothetical protein PENTCL1PPCAC_18798, partial [Pristionchus entomophagus]